MKKLLLLLFSLTLSFNSYGEWTKVNENTSDDSYYIDFQTLRPVDDDYVVWWEMRDLAKSNDGYMSSQIYYKGDCVQTRTKWLSIIQYTGSMGTGNSEDLSGGFVNLEDLMGWTYPPPDSVTYDNLRIVCLVAEDYSKSDYEKKVSETIAEFESYDWGDDDASYEIIEEPSGLLETAQSVYVNKIASKVRSNWRYQSAEDDWTAEVYVVQDRNGNVRAVDVRNANVGDSSRAKSFMDSLERAVYKSSPLPYTSDDTVFDREIYILFSVN
jgi:hypothetical protein